MVEEHLRQSARERYIEKVREIFEDPKVLVDTIGSRMSKNEVVYINE